MRTPRPLPDGTVEVMDELLAGELSAWQRERAMGLRLMALGRSNDDVAEIVGRHSNTVCKWRQAYRARGVESITSRTRGGRHNELLDEDVERAFVDGFIAAAERGEFVTISVIHEALVDLVGHPVWPKSVYRILERHGWRKLAPRPAHPGADPARREAFKETSPAWYPPPRTATRGRSD